MAPLLKKLLLVKFSNDKYQLRQFYYPIKIIFLVIISNNAFFFTAIEINGENSASKVNLLMAGYNFIKNIT